MIFILLLLAPLVTASTTPPCNERRWWQRLFSSVCVDQVPMLVQNVPPVGVDWPPPVDEKPNRLCRVVAHRKLAPKQSVFSSKDSYYEIDATPNDDALPQRTYIVDNVYLSAYPDEASERAMVEKLYPIGEPELCTPEFGQKQ